jgi:hypothetical protein
MASFLKSRLESIDGIGDSEITLEATRILAKVTRIAQTEL